MPSSERELIGSIATLFGAGFAALVVWAGTAFVLSGLVGKALAAGMGLGAAVVLLGVVLFARRWRRLVEELERRQGVQRDEPQGLPVHLPGVAAAPPRELP